MGSVDLFRVKEDKMQTKVSYSVYRGLKICKGKGAYRAGLHQIYALIHPNIWYFGMNYLKITSKLCLKSRIIGKKVRV